MKQYLDILRHVLENGKEKFPTRKNHHTGEWEPVDGGVKTLACPNVVFSHDMSEGFPLLTTKKMAWKSTRVELEGFLRGITSKKWYKDRNCYLWVQWCNPKTVQDKINMFRHQETMMYEASSQSELLDYISPDDLELKKAIQLEEDDLGAFYAHQLRRFNQCYDQDDQGWVGEEYKQEADQLFNIVNTLRTNPMDRRMVVSYWNPLQLKYASLPSCHWGWNVTVIDDELNLSWIQRSCDLLLGIPVNIAHYALLLSLLAHDSGFKPGNLTGLLVDCHLYENQLENARIQLDREPRQLPTIKFVNKSGNLKDKFDIFDWTYQDVELHNYDPHPPLEKVTIVV